MMLKKGIMLIMLGLIFSSCDFIYYGKIAVQDNIRYLEREKERKESRKKDGPSASGNVKYPEYKKGVKEAIQDIMKRPVNKKVEFEGLTLLIPENTRLNLKHGNVVDEKTGYGIPILFERDDYCTKVFYSKKVRNNLYILIEYNDMDKNLDVIGQKIIKANGFSKNCK